MIDRLSKALSVPEGKLLRKVEYPVQLYRYLAFRRMHALGYSHCEIAEVSGFSRGAVTYGIRTANMSRDSEVVGRFGEIVLSENESEKDR